MTNDVEYIKLLEAIDIALETGDIKRARDLVTTGIELYELKIDEFEKGFR